MPPMQIRPFMPRTMVEDHHGVKPLFPPAESPPQGGESRFRALGLTRP